MLAGLLVTLKSNDFALAERAARRDDEIDRLYTAIKLYLTQVSRQELEATESKRGPTSCSSPSTWSTSATSSSGC